jgi:hypothetical protein
MSTKNQLRQFWVYSKSNPSRGIRMTGHDKREAVLKAREDIPALSRAADVTARSA